jgi:hypothetical protein
MSEVTRQELINALDEGWGNYVPRFRQFSAQERAAFLQAQGYARLADLLGHVVAWWEQALQALPNLLEDPAFQTPDVDVDTFNAEAVSRFSELDEDSLVCSFLNLRSAWVDVVNNLPDEAFQDPRVCAKLHIELVGHLAEHAIAAPPA